MSKTWTTNYDKLGDGISLLAGLALAGLPFVVTMTDIAFWSALLTGGLIAVLAAIALWRPHEGLDWARMVAGVWAAISPWALVAGFTLSIALAHVALGVLALAFPAWRRWKNDGGNSALTA
ncbi:MAG: DUF4175 domain-containing protein [Rhodobacteraceae bacterium]|jgi:asparagine N-glycosylation enzyme membrane subunit Stt3|uniref:SPW repeat-containing integral membrane domain-containing protein n=5 Tax=Rhodobacterales TaxID=204455 RepID=A0A1X6YGC1_9RHOB|nr:MULTISPECIES: SPW repeat protein [Rhodobacterales]MAM39571.1 hypothetical protein [Erythrobacter sp.]MBR9766724.1 DUF4175 domain-containing protein [Paracoccaceae bacterium]AJE47419.1 hypothetical protein P73_2704 [Celeribacter indicus]APZ55147.1 SPW repeat protein [Salipiger abyssi]PTX46507.1 SPW repeat-containing protein [Allosediminivita pacifica]|tara:strand:- start:485 stop:847 length:363 start_codon:yes stop_codon:yes gene_type:complete